MAENGLMGAFDREVPGRRWYDWSIASGVWLPLLRSGPAPDEGGPEGNSADEDDDGDAPAAAAAAAAMRGDNDDRSCGGGGAGGAGRVLLLPGDGAVVAGEWTGRGSWRDDAMGAVEVLAYVWPRAGVES
jgi:hypothetical protein